MRALPILLLLLSAVPARAEGDLDLRTEKSLSPEQCLALQPADVATRCPTMGGRLFQIGNARWALVERHDQRRSLLCDSDGRSWRCRRIVVLDRELRGARRRNPQVYATASELLRLLATAPSVKLGDELGALFAAGERPRSCLDMASHGCAVQAVRIKAPFRDGSIAIKRRLWLVEDADGPLLQCSDATLTRCDGLGASAWLALLVTLRPSSLQTALPPPEMDLPTIRPDKRPLPKDAQVVSGLEAAETPVGALDPWLKGTRERVLPPVPPKSEVTKLAHMIEQKAPACLEGDQAAIELIFTGEANILGVTADGQPANACLQALVRKLPLPRFGGASYHLSALVRKK